MSATIAQLAVSGILLGGIYALIAMSLSLVWGVLRIVNFAHGDLVMVGMYLSYLLFQWLGLEPYYSLIIVTGMMFLFGMLVERLVIKKTINAPHVVQVFATFGLALVLQNTALLIWKGNMRSVTSSYAKVILDIGPVSITLTRVVAMVVVCLITAIFFIFLKYTYPGKAIRATAQNRKVAMLMGININHVYLYTFAISAALTGIAGALLMPIYSVYPLVGLDFIFAVFVIVVLGGLGSVPGALVGSILIGLVETFSGYFISTSMKQAVYFLLFILILIIKPSGLFGRRGEEAIGLE